MLQLWAARCGSPLITRRWQSLSSLPPKVPSAPVPKSDLAALSHNILQGDIKLLSEADVVNVAMAFATHKVKDARLFAKLGSELYARDLRAYSLNTLSTVIQCYARLNCRELLVMLKLSTAISKRDNVVKLLPLGEIASVLQCLAAMNVREPFLPAKISQEILQTSFCSSSTAFSPTDMTNTLFAFASLNYKDDALCHAFINAIIEEKTTTTTTGGWDAVSNEDLARLLFSLAKLDYNNISDSNRDTLLDDIARNICQQRDFSSLTFSQLAYFAWSFACLDALHLPHVRQLFTERAVKPNLPRQYPDIAAQLVFQAKLAWEQQQQQVGVEPSPLIQSMFMEKRVMPLLQAYGGNRKPRIVHLEVAQRLRKHFSNVVVDATSTSLVYGGLAVDILLPDHACVVQIDDHRRFFTNNTTTSGSRGGKTGKAKFLERLLEARPGGDNSSGFEVFSISERRYDQADEEERCMLIASIVRGVSASKGDT